jgi:hypothetical protein
MTDTIIDLDPLEEAKKGMRLIRNEAISKTDWMMLDDAVLPAGVTVQKVAAYRKFLRDLPNNATDEEFMTFKGVPSLADWTA